MTQVDNDPETTSRLRQLKWAVLDRAKNRISSDEIDRGDRTEVRSRLDELLRDELSALDDPVDPENRERLLDDILNEFTGFGPIEPLLQDDDVTEVMVNGPDEVYVEKGNEMIRTDVIFRDNEHVLETAKKNHFSPWSSSRSGKTVRGRPLAGRLPREY